MEFEIKPDKQNRIMYAIAGMGLLVVALVSGCIGLGIGQEIVFTTSGELSENECMIEYDRIVPMSDSRIEINKLPNIVSCEVEISGTTSRCSCQVGGFT